jgi:hypothetical protein
MAGFDVLQQPYQYHEPVAPVLPRENDAAKLIASTTDTVVGSFLRAATARKQADLEREKMAQDGALTLQGLELKRQELKQDYDLKREYYGILGSRAGEVESARKSAFMRAVEEAERRQRVNDELMRTNEKIKSEPEYKIIADHSNLDKDPVGYWAAYRRFSENHASDVLSIAPDLVKQVKPLLDQQKIPFQEGARWVEGAEITDDKGEKKTAPGHFDTSSATKLEVPVWQVAERYKEARDPEQKKQILWGLMAAGQHKVASSFESIEKDGQEFVRKKNVFSVSDPAQKILDAGERTDFSHGADKTPEMLTEKYKKGGALGVDYGAGGNANPDYIDPNEEAAHRMETEQSIPVEPAALPDQSSARPAGFAPTKTDQILNYARKALAANPDARDEIARRLAGMNINPRLLFS